METPTEKVCEQPTENGYLCQRRAGHDGAHSVWPESGDAHPTPPPAALAPERIRQFAKSICERIERGEVSIGRMSEVTGLTIDELIALHAPPPARAEAPEGAQIAEIRKRVEALDGYYYADNATTYTDMLALLAENARLTEALEQAKQEKSMLRQTLVAVINATDGCCVDDVSDAFLCHAPAEVEGLRIERDQQAGALVTLREALNAHSDTCVCGCSVADHEFYEEGGEACGHDDHECLRASRAVAATMVTRTSALEQLAGPCALGTLVYGGADRCGSCPSCIATAALGRDAGKTWYHRPSFAALAASAPASTPEEG